MASVFLLYEGDQWLSNDSLVCMGVFSNQKKLESAARMLIKERLNYNYDEDEFEGTKTEFVRHQMSDLFGRYLQTFDGEVLFMIKEVELNRLEEI